MTQIYVCHLITKYTLHKIYFIIIIIIIKIYVFHQIPKLMNNIYFIIYIIIIIIIIQIYVCRLIPI